MVCLGAAIIALACWAAVSDMLAGLRARTIIARWDEMGMFLPDEEQCAFFREHLQATQSALADSLAHPSDGVRSRGAYVIACLGRDARGLLPAVTDALEQEDQHFVRIYLIQALCGLDETDPLAIRVLRRVFEESHSTEEKIYAAAALYVVSRDSVERDEMEDYVCQYLAPCDSSAVQESEVPCKELQWSAVNAVRNMEGARDAIPLLEELLRRKDAAQWVHTHVPAALDGIRGGPGSKPPELE